MEQGTKYTKWVLMVLGLSLGACASITQGTSQIISFTMDPVDTRCSVMNKDGATLGVVSGRSNLLNVSKGASDLVMSCNAEGYEQKTVRVSSSTQTAGVIGVAIDFGITDMLTGAMWKYPDHVSVVLDKKGQ